HDALCLVLQLDPVRGVVDRRIAVVPGDCLRAELLQPGERRAASKQGAERDLERGPDRSPKADAQRHWGILIWPGVIRNPALRSWVTVLSLRSPLIRLAVKVPAGTVPETPPPPPPMIRRALRSMSTFCVTIW